MDKVIRYEFEGKTYYCDEAEPIEHFYRASKEEIVNALTQTLEETFFSQVIKKGINSCIKELVEENLEELAGNYFDEVKEILKEKAYKDYWENKK